jgi:hypothetical protein
MKLDALSVAAVAVAGLAVYAYAKPKTPGVAPSSADAAFAQAYAQRQASGAALPQNNDYLKNWQGLSDVFASQPDFYA